MQSLKNRSIAGTAALVATFVTIAAATPLRAAPVDVPVAYGDLDISTAAGAKQLDARIQRAAHKVCGDATSGNRLDVAACRYQLVKTAKAELAMKAGNSQMQLAAR